MAAKEPEIALQPDDARTLAKLAADVANHYPIPALNPGHAAIGALLAGIVTVHRRTFLRIRARHAGQEAPARGAEPAAGPRPADPPTSWFPNLAGNAIAGNAD